MLYKKIETLSISTFLALTLGSGHLASAATLIHDNTIAPSSTPPLLGKGNTTHMLTVKCPVGDGTIKLSRASLLDIPKSLISKNTDVALVSAHGLTKNNPCIVQDFEGNSRDVIKVKIAENYKAGTATDWGLIYFKSIPTQSVIRYPLRPHNLNIHMNESTVIQFAAARGLPQNAQSCRLQKMQIKFSDSVSTNDLFTHNCRAIAGQSGTPVTAKTAQSESLIGFHMGHIWMTQSPLTGLPNRLGYIRPFDQKLVDDIKTMIAED